MKSENKLARRSVQQFLYAGIRPLACAGCVLATVVPHGLAAEDGVAITPRIEVGATLTDNVFLTPAPTESDVVLVVEPGINIQTSSRRFEAALDYSADFLTFTSTGGTDLRHKLAALVDAEAIEDTLFLSARANVRQIFLDRGQGLSSSRANRTDNRQTVQTYTGQARLIGRLRSVADWSLLYRYGQTLSPADDPNTTLTQTFSDSQTHEYRAEATSGDRFGRLGWLAYAGGRRVERTGAAQNFADDEAGLELSYRLSAYARLLVGASYSDNDLNGATVSEDGFGWYGGFILTPSDRTRLELRAGQTGDRTRINGLLSHKFSERVTAQVSYTDELSAVALVENAQLQANSLSQDGFILGSDGNPIFDNDLLFNLSDSDFRRRSLNAGLSWRHKRTTASLNGVWERRTFTANIGTSETYAVNAAYQHELNSKNRIIVQSSYRHNRFETGDRSDDTILNSIEYQHDLYKNVLFVLNYRNSNRFSNQEDGDLRENAVSVFLRARF